MSVDAKPLLGEARPLPRLLLQICFAMVGLATSIIWNQLMLCVTVLTELFGRQSLARAATAQNASCAAAMAILTLSQRVMTRQLHGSGRLLLCAASLLLMMALGLILASMLHSLEASEHFFLALLALNGLATGMAQNLACAASTAYPGASGALLLGESLSPLVAVVIAETARPAATLLEAQVFVLGAVAALAYVSCQQAPDTAAPTVATCMLRGGDSREYLHRRMGQLLGNALVAFCCSCIWVFSLCSAPSLGAGLHGSSELPRQMLAVANVAASLGRFAGLKARTPWLTELVLESLLLVGLGFLLILSCIHGSLASPATASTIGLTLAAGLSAWSNVLLMRNDHSAQSSCGHSLLVPCHVTGELMWLSIQVGSIAGTSLAAL